MGTDNLFKKRKAKLAERKRELRDPKPNSFLIVSEGEKTEPLYFDGLAKHINDKYGDSISVEKPLIKTRGEGKCTVSLVEETSRIVSRSRLIYSQVWVVFDKDDFQDFDEAVTLAEARGFRAAWSNQSFEYWIYLHFHYTDSALHRDDWVKKLSDLLKKTNVCEKGYQKNDPDVFRFATTIGSLKAAVGNAIRIEKSYKNEERPSQCDPCTKVHHLILELKPYLDDLF